MRSEPTFPSIDQVLTIHQRVILEFGGNDQVRDYGLLESALALPEARFGGEFLHETMAAMAAAYLYHICQNHAFIDGNKRTALATAELFLDLNGFLNTASDAEAESLTLGVADGTLTKEMVIRFFDDHLATLEG